MAENQFLRQNVLQPPKLRVGPSFGDILPINSSGPIR